MKQLLVFSIFTALVFFSCDKKNGLPEKDFQGNKIYYNVEEFTKNPNFPRIKSNFQTVDTSCISQKIKALTDIKNGKLIFYTESRREIQLTKEMLKKINIEAKIFIGGCLKHGRFDPFCYQDEMQEEIYRRFGEKFIDSILDVSRSIYINNHPKEEYFEDGRDLREKYLSNK